LKSGLLSILACPICKNYPLQLKIFKWETETSKIEQIMNNIEKKEISKIRNDVNVKIFKSEDDIKIRDLIVREEKGFYQYIGELNNIYNDILSIEDDTKTDSSKILEVIKKELFDKIKNYEERNPKNQFKLLEQIEYYIFLSNWYLFTAEIEDGIMICDKCRRWYPIIETIPQMLPDEIRNEKSEIRFLEKWKELIDEKTLLRGKPFHLKVL